MKITIVEKERKGERAQKMSISKKNKREHLG